MKIIIVCVVICLASNIEGAAISRIPCLSRLREVREEKQLYGDIVTEPHYYPECENDGVYWKPTQCDHHDQGFCFCVNVETGVPREETKSHFHSKEMLNCDGADVADGEVKLCERQKNKTLEERREWGVKINFLPVCTQDGVSFKALQGDDVGVFCVDTAKGEKIPGTIEYHHSPVRRPISEAVCQAYSDQWQAYMDYIRSTLKVEEDHNEDEEVTEESCLPGFEFQECGCSSSCVPGNHMQLNPMVCKHCRPVCVCPGGTYEWEGSCITVEECLDQTPAEENHEILDIKGELWNEYLEHNPHPIISQYASGGFQEFSASIEYDPHQNEESPQEPPVEGSDPIALEYQPQVIPHEPHHEIFEGNYVDSYEYPEPEVEEFAPEEPFEFVDEEILEEEYNYGPELENSWETDPFVPEEPLFPEEEIEVEEEPFIEEEEFPAEPQEEIIPEEEEMINEEEKHLPIEEESISTSIPIDEEEISPSTPTIDPSESGLNLEALREYIEAELSNVGQTPLKKSNS
ncbi:uncharacterized protein LOC143449938 isoform X1 [Clavelina lepadiformis]|uniref:uncharacterized protein LOC143449938 isoform X1 n=1 Tax=Clavelina lepadiformis TaxID=159417 RepID=UPI0040433059